MGRMVVVGNERLVLALSAAGFVPEVCASPEEMIKALERLRSDNGVALVVVGESQASRCLEAVRKFREMSRAMLLILPDTPRTTRLGYELVRRSLEEAAGVDLLGRTDTDERRIEQHPEAPDASRGVVE